MRNVKFTGKGELWGMENDAIVICFKVLIQHLSEGMKESVAILGTAGSR